jgi:hypothetical protein
VKWIVELEGGPKFAANAATMCRVAAMTERPDHENEILKRVAVALDEATASGDSGDGGADEGFWDKALLPGTFKAFPVAKYAADAAEMGGTVFLRCPWSEYSVTMLEIHADGTVIAPDGWEVVIENGLLMGARPLAHSPA